MKLLFDQNLSFRLCQSVADLFPGSSQVRLLGFEQAEDRAIWTYAKEHGFTIVTLDADFSELSLLWGHPPKVVWLRCGNQRTVFIHDLLRRKVTHLHEFAKDPNAGCLELS